MSVVPPLRPLWPKQLAAACREFAKSEISHNAEAICSLRRHACAFWEFSECARNGFAGLFMFFFQGNAQITPYTDSFRVCSHRLPRHEFAVLFMFSAKYTVIHAGFLLPPLSKTLLHFYSSVRIILRLQTCFAKVDNNAAYDIYLQMSHSSFQNSPASLLV